MRSSLRSAFIPPFYRSQALLRSRTICTHTGKDVHYMREALQQAQKALTRNEVPIGAVIVDSTGVIAGGHNSVESTQNVTQHAELVALANATQKRGNWRLNGTTLYTTVEPCPMCLSAIALARIDSIVYGTRDLRLGACGTWIDLVNVKHPFHNFERVVGGVLEEEAAQLLRDFFRKRRQENKDANC